jgi:hypothetical protein
VLEQQGMGVSETCRQNFNTIGLAGLDPITKPTRRAVQHPDGPQLEK